MWAAVIPGREAWGACELRLKPSRRMSVSFKDEPRYKLTTANPKAEDELLLLFGHDLGD